MTWGIQNRTGEHASTGTCMYAHIYMYVDTCMSFHSALWILGRLLTILLEQPAIFTSEAIDIHVHVHAPLIQYYNMNTYMHVCPCTCTTLLQYSTYNVRTWRTGGFSRKGCVYFCQPVTNKTPLN